MYHQQIQCCDHAMVGVQVHPQGARVGGWLNKTGFIHLDYKNYTPTPELHLI